MASSVPAAERSLRTLQQLVRRRPAGSEVAAAMTRRLPPELASDEVQMLGLLPDEVAAAEAATAALLADLRFEHLEHAADDVWYFVAECFVDRRTDHVPVFVERHARQPADAICYIPVEFLTTASRADLLGITLLPVTDPGVPAARPPFALDGPVGCVAALPVRGTDYGRMADRARTAASHALRILRVALREYPGIADQQLRFRLSIAYSFGENLVGWNQRNDVAYNLPLAADLSAALRQPVAGLPLEPGNDIERKALLALQWLERACMTGEELVALLYRFFALEALLGDKSEGLKAHGMAFRQMVLGHLVTGSFPHPNMTLLLYDQIRSGAVHGEEVPGISPAVAASVERGVRDTLNQYLTLARDRGLTRRGRLLKLLDGHRDDPNLIDFLREYGGPHWADFLPDNQSPETDP